MKSTMEDFPVIKSSRGDIYTCIFFATKTPPGVEWYGFNIEKKDGNDILYYGLVDSNLNREMAFFSLRDIVNIGADYTTDPDAIKKINLPAGWEMID